MQTQKKGQLSDLELTQGFPVPEPWKGNRIICLSTFDDPDQPVIKDAVTSLLFEPMKLVNNMEVISSPDQRLFIKIEKDSGSQAVLDLLEAAIKDHAEGRKTLRLSIYYPSEERHGGFSFLFTESSLPSYVKEFLLSPQGFLPMPIQPSKQTASISAPQMCLV